MPWNCKRLHLDVLFWFQILCAVVFGGTQFVRMLTTTQGVSTSMVVFNELFVIIGFYLAIMSNNANRSRITRQGVVIYALGVGIYTSWLILVCLKGYTMWDARDTLTAAIVAIGIAGLVKWMLHEKLTWKDPVVRGVAALIFKAVPQTVMAWKVYQVGGDGLSGWMVVTFHLLTISRIYQLWFSLQEAKWDRNRLALFLSEIGNEASWCLVTSAWFLS